MPEDKFKLLEEKKGISTFQIILIISLIIFIVFLLLGILNGINGLNTPFRAGESPRERATDYILLGFAILIGPAGFYLSSQQTRIYEIEQRLPDFLRDVAEAGRFGMTLAEAIVVASTGRYGLLTPEIRKMAAQIQWGIPAGEALRMFSDRVSTPMVKRTVAIIIKANEAGGNVADVLTMVAHDAREARLRFEQRRVAMLTYVVVIYIAFFVFIATILILNLTFIPEMARAGQKLESANIGTTAGGGPSATRIEVGLIPDVAYAFFISVMVHAIGDGILAGVIDNGKIANGLRHSFLMIIIGWAILRFVGPVY